MRTERGVFVLLLRAANQRHRSDPGRQYLRSAGRRSGQDNLKIDDFKIEGLNFASILRGRGISARSISLRLNFRILKLPAQNSVRKIYAAEF